MGMNPGSPGFSVPAGEDAIVRKIKDLERTVRENAAARSLEAASIGAGGITVKDGGSITVESPGTIDLLGGAFAAASVTASGTVQGTTVQGTTVHATSALTAPDAYIANAPLSSNIITTGRSGLWGRTSDGWVGNSPSSRVFKTNIDPANIDPLAVLAIEIKHYNYLAEVRKRDDPTFPEYVGPEYHVALEVGAIAEDLHEAGLWEFVIYEQEIVTIDGPIGEDGETKTPVSIAQLKLDENGEPIPRAIHYELWSLAVHVAVQHVYGMVQGLQKRLTSVEKRLRKAGI